MAKGITVPVVQSGLEASIEAAAKKAGPLTLSATVDPSSFKRLAQPLGRVSGLATEFEKSIAASNARVIAFGASVGIINGVQNAFASLVKTTIEVEKSLTNIAVISGKTVDELQPFSRALFEIAKTTSQSFGTASEAALEFSRQGLSLEETLKRTQDALTLTRFTSLSAAEAVDVLTAATNSFGETGITTSEILNKLVAVDTKFAVSAEDLAKGLSRAGSIAQEVGVNFDELNAIVTIAQERTARGGAVIGNAFKTIFTRIRSDETIQALQSIGIYSFDAQGRLKPVVGLLEELAGKINTLSETKRIEVLEAIASKYNINILTALVDDLGSTASKFREARDVSAGAQSEAYQRQIELNKTLDAVITRVVNSAAQLADTLGRIGVTDSLKSLLNFFDNILTGINEVVDSEGIGGTIAKGLISGISGVFFKIGIPLLLAIFVKLTKDIAQFGTESLKTILGINKEVRERQALEQAVVNTLIKDQQVMATILSLSGDRRKQEEYLLSVYNRQLAALQQVQNIAAGVAPALQAAGLSATSGTVKRRAAEGYLPAAEAKDVRRGVGGASPSSKVVEIPNFSFGGGKRGTMVANTSEYIVPNYAGGSGTAIFNQDMAKEYGLPPGAKKITASGGFVPAGGFVPNFAEQKTEEFKKIAPMSVKEIAIKNSRAAREKDARFENSDKADDNDTFAANIKILRQDKSNADYNKQSNTILKNDVFKNFNKREKNISPQYESLIKRYKAYGADPQSISRLTTLVDSAQPGDGRAIINIKSAIKGIEGEIDASKKLKTKIVKGDRYFDLASGEEVKTRVATPASNILKKVANRFLSEKNIANGKKDSIEEQATVVLPSDGIISSASRGYIPNFAELNDKGIYAGLVGETAPDNQSDVQRVTKYVTPTEKGLDIYDTGIKSADSVTFDVYRVPRKNEFKLKSIRETLGNTGKNLAIDLAREVTGGALGNNVAEEKLAQTFNPGSLQGFANTIFEASVGALLSDKSFQDYTEQATNSLFDLNIAGNSLIKKNFGIKDSVNALEVKGASTPKLLNSIAEKIYKSTAGGQEAFTKRGKVYIEDPGRANNKSIARAFVQGGTPFVEIKPDVFQPITGEFDPSKYKLLKNPPGAYKTGASGYIPNYADPSTSLAIEKISDSSLQGKLDMAAEKAYGGFTEKRPIKAGVSKRFAAGTQNTPATLKFREALEKKGAGLEPLLNRPYGFMGLQLSTAPAGATFSISDPESVRKFNNPFPTEPEASRKPALVAVANYKEPTRDEIKKGVKPDVVAPQGQYANVSYATMFGAPVQLPALGVKSPAKKASFGYVPNFADLFVDYDYTIFGQQLGKAADFNAQKALIKNIPEDQLTEQERQARDAQMKLLTPFGQKLLQSKKPFKLATARWNDYQSGITSSLLGLGFNIRGQEDVFALGREFSEEQYKVDNPKFAEEMKKPEGERNTRVKPRIEPSAAQKKALFFKERAPQMATGDIDFVDNDVLNLQAVKSLMPKINTFTPDQYMAKLLIPQEVKGTKASLGYIPNFAENKPLKEAIGREIGAGVPPARVRVTQDGRLKNRDNPDGLAVINTRDEPNGKIPNDFRERGMRAAMASRGFVPNFAQTVKLEGAKSFTTEVLDETAGMNVSGPLLKSELEKLRKALNTSIAAYELEIQAGKDVIEAKKKLGEATKRATDEANLSQESSAKVKSSVEKAAGNVKPANAAAPLQLPSNIRYDKTTGPVGLGQPVSALLESEQSAKLKESISKAINVYEQQVKSGKDIVEAQKKLDLAIENQVRKYQLTPESAGQIAEAAKQSVKNVQPGGASDKKASVDLGKFLVLQTAIVGATSALQAFTDENSNAAKAIEGVNAGLSAVATFVSLAGSVAMPMRLLLTGITGLAAAAPLLARMYEAQKTPADRASEALAKLAKEAERTGQKLTPETILAKIAETRQQAKVKEESQKTSDFIREELKARKINASEQDILNLTGIVSATDSIQRNKEGKISGLAPDALNFLNKNGVLKSSTLGIGGAGPAVVAPVTTTTIDQNALQEEAVALLTKQIENERNRLSIRKKGEQLDSLALLTLQKDNELLLARQQASEAIFQNQLAINAAYSQESLKIEGLIAELDREKEFRTESYAIAKKAEIDKQKAEAEYNKTVQQIALDLRKNLGAGAKESVFGGTKQVQDFLGNLDTSKLQSLIDGYANALKTNKGALDSGTIKIDDVFGKVWTDFTNGLTGVPPELNNLVMASKEQFLALVRAAYETKAGADQTLRLNKAQVDFTAGISSANTKLRKLEKGFEEQAARLAFLQGKKTGFSPEQAKGVEEELNTERFELGKSIIDLKVANEKEIELLPKKIKTDLDTLNIKREHAQRIRRETKLSDAAAIAAVKLNIETEEKIYQLGVEAENSKLKYYADIRLIEAEDEAFATYSQLVTVTDEVVAENKKQALASKKARRSAQVLAERQRDIFDEEVSSLQDKIAIARAFNQQVGITELSNRVALELALEQEKLITSSRELSARQNNMAQELLNNQERTRQTSGKEILDAINTGNRDRLGFTGETRLAQILEQRLGDRKIGGDPSTGQLPMSQTEIDNLRKGMTVGERMYIEAGKLQDEAKTFQEIIGDQAPKLFADGMAQAMQEALNGADNLGEALSGIAQNFLKTLQSAFLQSASNQLVASIIPTPKGAKGGYVVKGYASGGLVTGGSGYKDDVPAMLSEGEYVIRKSSVNKYGKANLSKLNSGEAPKFANGGIFLPGVRGGTAISGYKDLTAFANQTTTSGATDVLRGGQSTAFANLEDQSVRLSRYALLNQDDTINQEVRSAQEQALNIMKEREAYRTAQRKAFQKQLVGTLASAALSYGVGQIANMASIKSNVIEGAGGIQRTNALEGLRGAGMGLARGQATYTPVRPTMTPYVVTGSRIPSGKAYGGMIRRYNAGGGPTDDIPALLMGGEYVMNRQATKKYGKQFFDSINQGRAPRFADGGQTSTSEPSFAEKAASSTESKSSTSSNVTININVTGGTSETQTQGDTKQGGTDYKKMGEQIKQIVIQTINEEKRLGGSLRPRG